MLDSMIGDVSDKVTAGVIDRLWAVFLSLLHGIGWGTILIGVGAILALILIFKLLSNIKVLAVLSALFLIAGFCLIEGFDFQGAFSHLTPAEDVKRLETARQLTR